MIEQVPRRLPLGARGDQLVPDRLMLADRLAELHPLLRIGPGLVDRGARDAERDGGNLQLLDIERTTREQLPALVPHRLAADDGAHGQPHIVEIHVLAVRIAQVDMLDVLHRHARRFGRNQHEREVAIAFLRRARTHEAVDVIGPVRAGAPALGPVDDDLVALAHRARLDARQVAADIGFGQAIGEEQLSLGQARQELGLLLGRSVLAEVHAAIEAGMDEGTREARPRRRQLLDDRDGRDQILPCPAMFFRNGERGEAQLVEFRINIARPLSRLVPGLPRLARRVIGDEPLDRRAQR